LPIVFALIVLAGNSRSRFIVQGFSLTAFNRKLDWQAAGIRVASDGNCYFACSSHAPDRGAAFFRYNTKTHGLNLLCDDVTLVCHEDPKSTPPQGKIRSDIVEVGGWLYFGTHLGNYTPQAESAYTGGHVIGFELATERFRDFGVLRPNYTILSGVAADARTGRLYVYVTRFPKGPSSHLYTIDVEQGIKRDLGSVHPRTGYAYYIFVDRNGNCWFSSNGSSGVLLNYDATRQRLLQWTNKLPRAYSWDDSGACPQRAMRWINQLEDGVQCAFTMEGAFGTSGDTLWLLNTEAGTNDSIRAVGIIGQTRFGLCYHSGRVYYIQPGYAKPLRVGTKVIQRIQAKFVSLLLLLNAYPNLRLRSISVSNGTVIDHGLIVDQKGQKPVRIDSIAVDSDENVYMVGEWRTRSRKDRSLLYEPQAQRYRELPAGQFFTVGKLLIAPPKLQSV
jgi:hypothetical protein